MEALIGHCPERGAGDQAAKAPLLASEMTALVWGQLQPTFAGRATLQWLDTACCRFMQPAVAARVLLIPRLTGHYLHPRPLQFEEICNPS